MWESLLTTPLGRRILRVLRRLIAITILLVMMFSPGTAVSLLRREARDALPRITALLDATIRYETARMMPLIEQMTRHLSEGRDHRWPNDTASSCVTDLLLSQFREQGLRADDSYAAVFADWE